MKNNKNTLHKNKCEVKETTYDLNDEHNHRRVEMWSTPDNKNEVRDEKYDNNKE